MFTSGMNYALLEEAVRDGRSDVADVALGAGASAAQLGIPLHEVMDHVERAHAGGEPTFETVRAVALGWVETALAHQWDVSCEHPLTSLSTVPHLRARLGDVFRGADRAGVRAGDTHALVVVELPRVACGNALEGALQALDVGEAMRTVFAGDETVAQVSPRRFAALVHRERADAVTVNLLGLLLERLDVVPRLWVEQLPGSSDDIGVLLAGLSA